MDLLKIQNELENFAKERDWEKFHSVKNLAMALSVETAELVEIVQWLKEEESNAIKNDPQTLEKLSDEVADIFLYLLRIVSKTNINLEEVVYRKMKKNAEKYPIELAKGNAKKYDQF